MTKRFVLSAFLILATSLGLFKSASGQETIELLKQREAKIKKVVKSVMPATVCVTDGIGFGSGVVVSRDGIVLTAGHVLLTEGKVIELFFPDGRKVTAKRLGKNLDVDAGMVKIIDEGVYPYVELGSSESVKKGDWVVALGHPGGYELGRTPPVRAGRVLKANEELLVTGCALIGGDSGGPLFDLDGKLIGIHSSIGSSIVENRHVAVKNYLRDWDKLAAGKSWGELKKFAANSSKRAVLGVVLDLQAEKALVVKVRENSAASEAGFEEGDVVLEVNGDKIRDSSQLIELISSRKPGEIVKIQVERKGRVFRLRARLRGNG